jgi:peptide/nickel transport system ATP-binding protein
VVAARDVSLDVFPNQCLALVGESGSGKTSIARCIAGLMAPASGVLEFQGEPLRRFASHRSLEQRRRIQMIFQNPRDSLNPRWRIVDTVARPAERFLGSFNAEAKSAALRLLEQVRLPLALAGRYPSELSGGELQRVAIARALICNPELIICDEITSALDVSVQATVLDLIDEIRKERQLAMLFVTHDLGVVARIADDVLVLKSGEVQECARAEQVLLRPEADYTRLLIASAATMETGEAREQVTAS